MTCISICSGLTSVRKVRSNSILVLSVLDGKWACVLQWGRQRNSNSIWYIGFRSALCLSVGLDVLEDLNV